MPVNFAPGDSKSLVKAEIRNQETNEVVVAYFNPKEITIDKTVPWQKHKNSELDEATLEFTAAEPETMQAEFLFDMFEEKGDVYQKYIKKLQSFAMVSEDKKRPPMVTFTWGAKMPVFKGVLENVNVKYTLFLPDGTPTRATVTAKFKRAKKLMNKKEAEAANKKAEAKKGAVPPAGARADQVNANDPRAGMAATEAGGGSVSSHGTVNSGGRPVPTS